MYPWGRKDGFPGADGSTIESAWATNATTIPIYGANGNTPLTEGIDGYKKINITTNGILDDNNSLIYSLKNPFTFIYMTASPSNWYTNNKLYQNDILWGDCLPKSIYDPCPTGWRLPQNGTWNDFINTITPYYSQGVQTTSGSYNVTNGNLYKDFSWYPAGGRRNSDNGDIGACGNTGFYWSSSVEIDGTSAIHLKNSFSNILVNAFHNRGYGLSVRCIQE